MRRAAIGLAVAAHLWFAVVPTVRQLKASAASGDFASYYYALQTARAGGDPYDVRAISARARADGSRRTVQPYFYPPPFLLTQLWALPLGIGQAQWGMFLLNELTLALALVLLGRFGVGPVVIALMLGTYTPIAENLRMLQANFMTLAPLLGGLALRGLAPLVGAAAMFKMSPALTLLDGVLRRRWREVAAGVLGALVLAAASVALVEPAYQLRFYLEVLPGFARGDYHGLQIPVAFPGNHSLPGHFARVWPSPEGTRLSPVAVYVSRAVSAALLALWAWRTRTIDRPHSLGALFVLLTVLPTFTWESHLVFLLLPLGLLLQHRPALGLVVYALLAAPMAWTHWAYGHHRLLAECLRASKTLAELLLFVGMLFPTQRFLVDAKRATMMPRP